MSPTADGGGPGRITLARGIAAFQSTGLEATRDRWSASASPAQAADGLAAVALAETGLPQDYLQAAWLKETFGSDYVHGFGLGFAGHARPYVFPVGTRSSATVLGAYDDGVALWSAVSDGVSGREGDPEH